MTDTAASIREKLDSGILHPVLALGFKHTNYSIKYAEKSDHWSYVGDTKPSVFKKQVSMRLYPREEFLGNVSNELSDKRIIILDGDESLTDTPEKMRQILFEGLPKLRAFLNNSALVYGIDINKKSGAFHIRLYGAGVLFINGSDSANELLSNFAKYLSENIFNHKIDICAYGYKHSRTRLVSTEHNFFDGEYCVQAFNPRQLAEFRLDAMDWLEEKPRNSFLWLLKSILPIKPVEPRMRLRSRADKESQKSNRNSQRNKAPSYGDGTRFETVPEIAQIAALNGMSEKQAVRFYMACDNGTSKDMRSRRATVLREFERFYAKTELKPSDGEDYITENKIPDKLIYDKGSFEKLFPTSTDQKIVEDLLTIQSKLEYPDAKPWVQKRAVRDAIHFLELVCSKHLHEAYQPIMYESTSKWKEGTFTMNFNGREREHPGLERRMSSQLSRLKRMMLPFFQVVFNPNTGRAYNWDENPEATRYRLRGSALDCLVFHLKSTQQLKFNVTEVKLLEYQNIEDYKIIYNEKSAFDSISIHSIEYKNPLIDKIISCELSNLLKSPSLDLKARIAESRQVNTLIKSVPQKDKFRLLALFRGGSCLKELLEEMSMLVEFGNLNSRGILAK